MSLHVAGHTKEEDDEFFGKLAQAVFGRELVVEEVGGAQHVALQGGLGMELKVGDKAQGLLFNDGIVVAIGTAEELMSYDHSAAVQAAITEGDMALGDECVAIRHDSDTVAVYVADEVWLDA